MDGRLFLVGGENKGRNDMVGRVKIFKVANEIRLGNVFLFRLCR